MQKAAHQKHTKLYSFHLIPLIILILGLILGARLVSQKELFNFFPKASGKPVPQVARTTTIKDLMGVNVVVNDNPSDIARVASWVRDYHKWYWYEGTEGKYTWSSGWQKLDYFYKTLTSLGVRVMPSVEFFPCWASAKSCRQDQNGNGIRVGYPKPEKHAKYLEELIKHYGNNIAAVENYNEPNQWWVSDEIFPKNEFAKMTEADYAAVKKANASMPFVLAGLAGTDTGYISGVNADKYDVINFHWYALGDESKGGRNPEAGNLLQEIDKVNSWRDKNAPGKQIWITEFGWDTSVGEGKNKGKISRVHASELTAANYLVRSFLLMHAKGIEKGFVFDYRDVSNNPEWKWSLYNSSGLVELDPDSSRGEKDGRKKAGWYYLATLKNTLGDYVLEKIVSDGPSVYHYEYIVPGTDKKAAVLWTRNGDRDKGYTEKYSGPAGTLIEFKDNSATGISSETKGDLTLSEKPIIIVYKSDAQSTEEPTPTSIIPSSTPQPTTAVTGDETALVTSTLSCISKSYKGDGIRVAWSNEPRRVVSVNISEDPTFSTYYQKRVFGNEATTLPDGFTGFGQLSGKPLVINPDATYYLHLFDGNTRPSITFSIKSCSSGNISDPTPTNIPTSTPKPTSAPTPTPGNISTDSTYGLNASYYKGTNFDSLILTTHDPVIDFSWGNASPDSSIPENQFSVRWTGYVVPPRSGEYTFYTESDDGVKMWVNNELLIDQWRSQNVKEYSGTINLTANQKYPIKLEYFEGWGQATVQLMWSGPGIDQEIIAENYLLTD